MKRSAGRIPEFALYGENRGSTDNAALELHIEEIQIRSRKYRWEIGPHFHSSLVQCIFVSAGPATVHVDATGTVLEGPALAVIPACTVHAFRFARETQGFVLTLATERLSGAAGTIFRPSVRRLFAAARLLRLQSGRELPTRLHALFSLLLEEYRRPDSLQAPVCASLAHALLWLIGRELQDRTRTLAPLPRQHEYFERFQALLEKRFRDHWTVDRYARALGMTAPRLTPLCGTLAGCSAFELIQRRLLIEAQRRLIYTTLSIKYIARDLGFDDPAYFCRFFRRCCQMSPQQFRQQPGRE